MKCEACGLEMMIYRVAKKEDGTKGTEYVCRNRKCTEFDQRLKKPAQ